MNKDIKFETILNESSQNFANSNLIHLINKSKSQYLDSTHLLNKYSIQFV